MRRKKKYTGEKKHTPGEKTYTGKRKKNIQRKILGVVVKKTYNGNSMVKEVMSLFFTGF